MKIIIHRGKPTANDFAEIGRMIEEGYHTGIDMPWGISWEIEK